VRPDFLFCEDFLQRGRQNSGGIGNDNHMKTISRSPTLLTPRAIKQDNKLESTSIMKPIHRSSFRGSIVAVVTSSAVMLLAFAFATSQVHAQTENTPTGGNVGNTATGDNALDSNTTGDYNTADGFNALTSNTTGSLNTAVGANALLNNISGDYNTANGYAALFSNTTGRYNTATGYRALSVNTTGTENTANGVTALILNRTGSYNTANGASALHDNTTASHNTADGNKALYSNTTGGANTASGFGALYTNRTGYSNTADGVEALWNNDRGVQNTASGDRALFSNTEGAGNTANGFRALYNNRDSGNTADGYQALYNTTGSSNIGLGTNAGYNLTSGSGNVCIGAGIFGVAGESNTTRIRNVYSSVASGRTVYVNSDNKIGTLVSSRRFKGEIKPMDKVSEAILALKPVTFRYKKEIEPNGTIMFGLIAEEVEKVDPELVTRNDKGQVETVRYEAVNAMLLNEFLKEHRTVQELKSTAARQEANAAKQEATIARQQKQIEALVATVKEQATQIQKVSAHLEASKPAPQIVLNNQ
jgi:hypothetical protein